MKANGTPEEVTTSRESDQENPSQETELQATNEEHGHTTPRPVSKIKRIVRGFVKALCVLFALVFVIVAALLTLIWIMVRGPSPSVQQMFVLTVKETSAVGFLAHIFLSDYEVESILNRFEFDGDFTDVTDPSLITIPTSADSRPDNPFLLLESGSDAVFHSDLDDHTFDTDFDNSIIELVPLSGSGFTGYMMIVHDPTRIYISAPNSFGGLGVRLADKVRRDGAVGGINGGGFNDPEGQGIGGTPEGLVIMDGVVRWTTGGGWWGDTIIGFDSDGILHVGSFTIEQAVNLDLQWAVNFGPALIINGSALPLAPSGVNPRTAIGQRADGAVLMLVIEGRQGYSFGASMTDLQRIFLEFEAVNAANLDGGSSTMMVYEDRLLIRSGSIYGPRRLATSFLVRDIG